MQLQVCRCGRVTGHGQAAASGPALVLAQLAVQFGLGRSGCRRRQVGVAQLPKEERRGSSKLLLEERGTRGTDKTFCQVVFSVAE